MELDLGHRCPLRHTDSSGSWGIPRRRILHVGDCHFGDWALVKVYGDGFVVEGGWGRTTNLLGNNQVLCQLSYAPSLVQRSVGPVVP